MKLPTVVLAVTTSKECYNQQYKTYIRSYNRLVFLDIRKNEEYTMYQTVYPYFRLRKGKETSELILFSRHLSVACDQEEWI